LTATSTVVAIAVPEALAARTRRIGEGPRRAAPSPAHSGSGSRPEPGFMQSGQIGRSQTVQETSVLAARMAVAVARRRAGGGIHVARL